MKPAKILRHPVFFAFAMTVVAMGLYIAIEAQRPGSSVYRALVMTPHEKALEMADEAERSLASDEMPQAVALYDRALEYAPNDARILHRSAIANLKAKNPARALSLIDRSLALDPHLAEARLDRAYILFESGLYDRALVEYDCMIASPRQDRMAFAARLGRILVMRAQKKYTQALTGLSDMLGAKSTITDSQRVQLMEVLGDCQLDLGRTNEAISAYTGAIRLDKQNATLYYNRALAYYKTGQNRESFDDLTRAVQIKPNTGKYHLRRARLALTLNDQNVATSETARALTLMPGDVEVLQLKKDLDQKSGQNSP